MDNQYSLYAIMYDGSRYILNFDEDFFRVLNSLISGKIEKESIEIMQRITLSKELIFLYKLSNNECKSFMIKDKENSTITRIEPDKLK